MFNKTVLIKLELNKSKSYCSTAFNNLGKDREKRIDTSDSALKSCKSKKKKKLLSVINYNAEPLSFADVGRAYILEGLCGQIETSLCVRYSVLAKFSQGDCDY